MHRGGERGASEKGKKLGLLDRILTIAPKIRCTVRKVKFKVNKIIINNNYPNNYCSVKYPGCGRSSGCCCCCCCCCCWLLLLLFQLQVFLLGKIYHFDGSFFCSLRRVLLSFSVLLYISLMTVPCFIKSSETLLSSVSLRHRLIRCPLFRLLCSNNKHYYPLFRLVCREVSCILYLVSCSGVSDDEVKCTDGGCINCPLDALHVWRTTPQCFYLNKYFLPLYIYLYVGSDNFQVISTQNIDSYLHFLDSHNPLLVFAITFKCQQ